MQFVVYRDASNQWRWYLLASNNRKIANSGEGYYNRDDCLHAIGLVQRSSTATISYA